MEAVPVAELDERAVLDPQLEAVAALDRLAHLVGELVALEVGGSQRADHPLVKAVTGELVVQEVDLLLQVVDLLLVQVDVLLRDQHARTRRPRSDGWPVRSGSVASAAASVQLSWRWWYWPSVAASLPPQVDRGVGGARRLAPRVRRPPDVRAAVIGAEPPASRRSRRPRSRSPERERDPGGEVPDRLDRLEHQLPRRDPERDLLGVVRERLQGVEVVLLLGECQALLSASWFFWACWSCQLRMSLPSLSSCCWSVCCSSVNAPASFFSSAACSAEPYARTALTKSSACG